MSIQMKIAEKSQVSWINEKYQEISFPESVFDNEIIVIAYYNNEPAGLGRVISIDGDNAELGGIYVFEAFRGKGLAGEIVKSLLKKARKFTYIYCLPFENLQNFYEQSGFKIVNREDQRLVPDQVIKKQHWCNDHPEFKQKVLLMGLQTQIEKGIYKHYKGKLYEVIGEVLHAKTREILVLYKTCYEVKNSELGPNPLFVRPKSMFLEEIKKEGQIVQRFKKVKK